MPPGVLGQREVDSDSSRFQLLIDAVTEYAIYMLDLDGLITSWNSGGQRLKGYKAAEIIGQHHSRFFTPQDLATGEPGKHLAQALVGGHCESEQWLVRKDGTLFLALTVVQTVKNQNGHLIGFAVVTRDITDRHLAQEALLASERRFRYLVEGVTDYAIYMLDPNGVVTNWNAGAERIKGYTANEIVGHHFSTFYAREDRRAGLPAQVLDMAAREGRYEAEGWRVRKDGARFWAAVVVDAIRDNEGRLIGFVKITRDITERREAQELLRDSERQFSMLIDGVSDYALYMLDPNGIVTSWNSGAERIKGYRASEIIGQHFSTFYTDNERVAGAPVRSLLIAGEQGRYEAEGWRVRKDGSLFWANVVIDAVRDEQGKLVGFAKITRDITERRDAQKALQEAQVQLAHSQKMDALGQLTGGVAHDFNNLLTIVLGNLRHLQRVVGDDARAQQALQSINLAAKRGATLTRQLLSFSRRQSLQPTAVRLDQDVAALRSMLGSALGGSVKLVTTIPSDIWTIWIDPSELELALLNLAINARDAMPKGGIVTIRAENVRAERGEVPENLEGEFVALTVADTGSGIPTDIKAKVFDPFFTTKQPDKGTGLGLSQVHGFVHQAGGTIALDSEMGKGTRVTLFFPRSTNHPATATDSQGRETTAAGGRALLLEDNPEVLSVSRSFLEELGYCVNAATDAATALEASEDAPYDLVLSDIVMAGAMNGLEFARILRAKYPDQKILLVTGYSEAAEEAAKEFTVVRKPYLFADLTRALARLNALTPPQRADAEKVVNLSQVKRDRDAKSPSPSRE